MLVKICAIYHNEFKIISITYFLATKFGHFGQQNCLYALPCNQPEAS